jgi:aminoglycoside phosphotransferase (APT) family kinase protein
MRDELGLADARIVQRLSGGNSNVTELLQHAGGQLIIRRAPQNAISDSASKGIAREYQMLRALKGKAPVPDVLGFCADSSILGGAFIVMQSVDGVSMTKTLPADYADTTATLNRIGEELIDGLAAIHNVDWASLELNRPAPPPDYLKLQIERWMKTRAASPVRDLPLIQELGGALLKDLPPAPRSCVVHGDFHLDNTLFRRNEPRLAAVIDWELASIGDPLADVGLMLAFWGPRFVDPPGFDFVQKVTCRPGLISRLELAQRWSRATGIDIGAGAARLNYYCAYSLWRLAAIVEGAYALQVQGQVDSDYSRGLEHTVPRLLEEAAVLIRSA